ncbi:hypothetical protein CAPTEDRAFT_196905 [Capitella teleta]|uniref:Methyltransferase domain-containing protein n=1 Tax=Capitella teleta TaxID=283909 RepID=R7VJW1_CAPTE|nr:hypothetical protein CAPTEDRAFT_196905 [Capitella teleta]|eukprot:ELU16831.1 hypothetical protein CAPTEDRAFT_196905 [Capitella teleta]
MKRIQTAVVPVPVCLIVVVFICLIGVVCLTYSQDRKPMDTVSQALLVSTPHVNPIRRISQTRDAAFDLVNALSFLPYGNRECIELAGALAAFAWPKGYQEAVDAHSEVLDIALKGGKKLEGHSGQVMEQQMVYVKLAQLPFVKTICETGFNAGHSTLIWLTAKNGTKVYSFDLGNHGYAKTMAQHLQSQYPGRLTVTWGDSTKTLPEFRKSHPEVTCDLIIVDGGHLVRIATDDHSNFRRMASLENIVVFDDYPTRDHGHGKELAPVWESQIRGGTLAELYACTDGKHCGVNRTLLTD